MFYLSLKDHMTDAILVSERKLYSKGREDYVCDLIKVLIFLSVEISNQTKIVDLYHYKGSNFFSIPNI